jgi:hypothetical protein
VNGGQRASTLRWRRGKRTASAPVFEPFIEALLEISTFLNNPRGWLLKHIERKKILSCRLRKFGEAFEMESEDLRRWAFSEAVLSAWWTFEETGTD